MTPLKSIGSIPFNGEGWGGAYHVIDEAFLPFAPCAVKSFLAVNGKLGMSSVGIH
jgi:hypothetical protein